MPITTQVDTANQFGWDTRVQEYDENGVLVASNTIYDNGIEISRIYAMSEGEYSYHHIVTELRIDHNDVTGWTTIFTATDLVTFNEVQQVTQFDDGRVRTASYIDFNYVTVVEEDLENAYSWTTRTSEGIVQGSAEYYFDVLPLNWGVVDIHLVNDDQTEEFISTGYGIEGSHWIYDLGDQYDWSVKSTQTFEDGYLMTSLRMDNGLFYSSTSLDGLLTKKIWYDGDDTFNWNVKETYFHVTGQVRGRYIEFDDGVVNVEYYDDGNLTEIIQTDYDDARNWETIDTFYATNGLKSERTTTYDNGIVRVEQWDENGDRSTRTEVDTLDVRAWDSRTTSYFDTGVVALSETTLDSGDEIIFAYQTDGDRDLRIQVDGDDSHTWAYRVTEYGDDGQNPTSTTYQSLDDVPEAYLSYLVLDTVLG